MTTSKDRAIVVSALKHAAPYIRLFKGKVFVLKVGGEVFADPVKRDEEGQTYCQYIGRMLGQGKQMPELVRVKLADRLALL